MIADFVLTTYVMMSRISTSYHFNYIASWSEEGDKLVIKDKNAFALKILPFYFNHNNLHSFIRSLYRYGFRKSCSFPNLDSNERYLVFFHEFFLEGKRDLLCKVTLKSAIEPNHEIINLKDSVSRLEDAISTMQDTFDSNMKILGEMASKLKHKSSSEYLNNEVSGKRLKFSECENQGKGETCQDCLLVYEKEKSERGISYPDSFDSDDFDFSEFYDDIKILSDAIFDNNVLDI